MIMSTLLNRFCHDRSARSNLRIFLSRQLLLTRFLRLWILPVVTINSILMYRSMQTSFSSFLLKAYLIRDNISFTQQVSPSRGSQPGCRSLHLPCKLLQTRFLTLVMLLFCLFIFALQCSQTIYRPVCINTLVRTFNV